VIHRGSIDPGVGEAPMEPDEGGRRPEMPDGSEGKVLVVVGEDFVGCEIDRAS